MIPNIAPKQKREFDLIDQLLDKTVRIDSIAKGLGFKRKPGSIKYYKTCCSRGKISLQIRTKEQRDSHPVVFSRIFCYRNCGKCGSGPVSFLGLLQEDIIAKGHTKNALDWIEEQLNNECGNYHNLF
jgi:hypothetical protein